MPNQPVIAGKVAIVPKGNWNAATAYKILDLVHYLPSDTLYLAKRMFQQEHL